MSGDLHIDILPREQQRLLGRLSNESFLKDWYLAGGTCLALYLGHRRSFDFDFFIPADFNTSHVVNILAGLGNYQRSNEEKNTVNGILDGVKVSFLGYKYEMIEDFGNYDGIRLAGIKDIAAMKLEAIAGRGSRKDFVDLFFILKQFSLEEILAFHATKYGPGLNNQYHLNKSLLWFADADQEVMPLMTAPLKWEEVKRSIIRHVRDLQT